MPRKGHSEEWLPIVLAGENATWNNLLNSIRFDRELKVVHIPAGRTFSGSRKAIRLITLWNFLIFGLFAVPPAHRWVDRGFLALRAIDLEDPVGWSLQVWLVGSTLLTTALLGRMLWRKRRTISTGVPAASVRLEGMLVGAWWLIVIGASAYGFMLGMGG